MMDMSKWIGRQNQAPKQCSNCGTLTSSMWRRTANKQVACNACGLYYKLYGVNRPIEMRKDIVYPRNRYSKLNGQNKNGQTKSQQVAMEMNGHIGTRMQQQQQQQQSSHQQQTNKTTTIMNNKPTVIVSGNNSNINLSNTRAFYDVRTLPPISSRSSIESRITNIDPKNESTSPKYFVITGSGSTKTIVPHNGSQSSTSILSQGTTNKSVNDTNHNSNRHQVIVKNENIDDEEHIKLEPEIMMIKQEDEEDKDDEDDANHGIANDDNDSIHVKHEIDDDDDDNVSF